MAGQSCLRRKGGVTGSSFCAPIQRNSNYLQIFRRSLYNTIWPKHSHSPIRRYRRHPPGTRFAALLQLSVTRVTCTKTYMKTHIQTTIVIELKYKYNYYWSEELLQIPVFPFFFRHLLCKFNVVCWRVLVHPVILVFRDKNGGTLQAWPSFPP